MNVTAVSESVVHQQYFLICYMTASLKHSNFSKFQSACAYRVCIQVKRQVAGQRHRHVFMQSTDNHFSVAAFSRHIRQHLLSQSRLSHDFYRTMLWCLSACLSHGDTVSKRLNISFLSFSYGAVDAPLYASADAAEACLTGWPNAQPQGWD